MSSNKKRIETLGRHIQHSTPSGAILFLLISTAGALDEWAGVPAGDQVRGLEGFVRFQNVSADEQRCFSS